MAKKQAERDSGHGHTTPPQGVIEHPSSPAEQIDDHWLLNMEKTKEEQQRSSEPGARCVGLNTGIGHGRHSTADDLPILRTVPLTAK